MLLISAALLLQMALFKQLGFIPTAIVLFMAVSYGFGSRRLLRDGAIAVALAFGVYFGFTRGLNLQLPAGVLAGLL